MWHLKKMHRRWGQRKSHSYLSARRLLSHSSSAYGLSGERKPAILDAEYAVGQGGVRLRGVLTCVAAHFPLHPTQAFLLRLMGSKCYGSENKCYSQISNPRECFLIKRRFLSSHLKRGKAFFKKKYAVSWAVHYMNRGVGRKSSELEWERKRWSFGSSLMV